MKILDGALHAVRLRLAHTYLAARPQLISWPSFILAFTIVLVIVWEIGGSTTTLAPYFGYMLPIFLLSICLLLPRTHALATSLICIAVLGLLTVANSMKIAVTQLPLTTMDFYVFWTGPEGVVDLLGLPGWTSSIVRPVIVVVLVAFAFLLADGLIRVRLLRQPRGRFTVIIALALSALAALFTHNYLQRVSTLVLREGSAWQLDRAADLSRQMGVLGFLAYSYYVAGVDPGDYFSPRRGAPAPSDEAVLSAASSFVAPNSDPNKPLPNIVVLFAESTFNPFYSFDIETKESFPLFEHTAETQGLGPLHVNTVGGGSWISEFESIVGVDARLFGYAGFYPHSALSPYIRKSLPMYLKEYGYVSSAYYAPLGSFFNARKAFLAYGFDYFYDGKDLDLPEWNARDAQIVNAVLSRANSEPLHYPFFKYIGLVENHGSHECIDFKTRDQFDAVFLKTDDFSLNCTLNQYLRIARSTESGFIAVVNELKALEKKTGRPWVVLIFGDHQPHSMSMSGTSETPFMQLIARGDERITFWHLASSVRGVVTCCGDAAPPLAMMPSLISAFVASDVAHLYLPTAFYAYQQCGSNLMGNHRSSGLLPAMFDDANDIRTTFCPQYESLLTAFRRFEVLGTNVPK